MILVIGVLLFMVSFEAVMWGWTLNRHGDWIKRHPEMDRRKMVSPVMLKMACAMSSILSIVVWLWWLYLNSIGDLILIGHDGIHATVCTLLVFSIQLSHIHFSAMTARYACLPRSYWPMLSKLVSIGLVKIFKIDEPPLTSCDVHRCWHNLAKEEPKTRSESE